MAGIDNRELARRLGEIVDGLEKPDMGDAWFDRLPAVRIERP
jgi:hypothetical protein